MGELRRIVVFNLGMEGICHSLTRSLNSRKRPLRVLGDYGRNAYQKPPQSVFYRRPDELSQVKRPTVGGEPGSQLSHHMRCQQITPMKGMHGLVWPIQTALIMHPCGPQIHIRRSKHVFIDPNGTVKRQQWK